MIREMVQKHDDWTKWVLEHIPKYKAAISHLNADIYSDKDIEKLELFIERVYEKCLDCSNYSAIQKAKTEIVRDQLTSLGFDHVYGEQQKMIDLSDYQKKEMIDEFSVILKSISIFITPPQSISKESPRFTTDVMKRYSQLFFKTLV